MVPRSATGIHRRSTPRAVASEATPPGATGGAASRASGSVNAAPVAANDNISATYNTPLYLAASALLANDTDSDGDSLAITGVGDASNGTVSYDAASSTLLFTPTSGYTGAAGFSYTVSDGQEGTATATVTVTVIGENDAPVTIADIVWPESDSAATGDLLSNDSDPEGDALSVTAINGEPVVFGQAVTLPSGATVTVNADGSFLYDPNDARADHPSRPLTGRPPQPARLYVPLMPRSLPP